MPWLHTDDLRLAVSRLPERLALWLQETGPRAFAAGGHIRASIAGERMGDVDVFTASREVADSFFREDDAPFETEFARSLPVDGRIVQIIHWRHFETPAELLEHFDFTICQAALWWEAGRWESACTGTFYEDLAARRLVYTQRGNPVRSDVDTGGTLLRLMKYAGKGYHAAPETVAAVAWDAVAKSADVDGLVASLRGIDPAYWPAWAREEVFG